MLPYPVDINPELKRLGDAPRSVRYTADVQLQRRDLWVKLGIVAAFLTALGQFCAARESLHQPIPDVWGLVLVLYGLLAVLFIIVSEYPRQRSYSLLRTGTAVVATVIRRSGHGEKMPHSEEFATTVNQVICAFNYPTGELNTASFIVSDALFEEWQLDTPIIILIERDSLDFVPYLLLTGVELN